MEPTHIIRTTYMYSETGIPYPELDEILTEVDNLREARQPLEAALENARLHIEKLQEELGRLQDQLQHQG